MRWTLLGIAAIACGPAGKALPPAETADTAEPVTATSPSTDGTWRSALYPTDWTPAFTAPDGGFLHDFSYAGYHRGEVAIPSDWPGTVRSVADFGASPGLADNAPAFQAAIDAVQADGGGVVLVPDGDWVLLDGLRITASGVLIRGASRDGTRLWFGSPDPARAGIVFEGAGAVGADVPLIADGEERGTVVHVGDPTAFSVGEDVLLDWTITQAFVDEHQMSGLWDAGDNSALGLRKTFFRREILAIEGDAVTLDVPLRYPALLRDGAALRPDTGALGEVGIEHLSLANATDLDAALASPRVHVLSLHRVRDAFVRDVGSFDPSGEASASHLRSGGVEVVESKRVTVADSALSHAQHHGDGGAGYAFEVSMSSDVLFADDATSDVRHGFIQNWDFGTSGVVFLRCEAEDDTAVNSGFSIPGRSELHHRLAMAVLFDGCRDTSGFAAYNRGDESSNAGHAGTETVFWNVSGSGPESRLSSYQFGRGYVIGTSDLTALVVPDLADALLTPDAGTEPVDWLEGVDAGGTLAPASLYEDQLARRTGR